MLSGTTAYGHLDTLTCFSEICDSWYEALSMILEMAMWLSKHAAWVAGKDEVRENEAKEVLNCLRKAAGMFDFVKANMSEAQMHSESAGRISGASAVEGSDFDERVLDAYRTSSCAEAQEVSLNTYHTSGCCGTGHRASARSDLGIRSGCPHSGAF